MAIVAATLSTLIDVDTVGLIFKASVACASERTVNISTIGIDTIMVSMLIGNALVDVQAVLTRVSRVIAGWTSASVSTNVVGAGCKCVTWVGGAFVNITANLVACLMFETSWADAGITEIVILAFGNTSTLVN